MLLGLALLGLGACGGPEPESGVLQGINQGNQALDFTLQSLDGREVSLSSYKGSVVLVNFWATWCPPCREEIPDFEATYRHYKDEGFVVLGINAEEPQGSVQAFVTEMGMTFPVLLDKEGKVANEYRALGLPMSLLVDREGVISLRHLGYLSGDQLQEHLADLLPGP
jgi:peroxiredoxin